MADQKWMLYGVTGYTGKLMVEEAVARGHKPIVAGRNAEKVAAIADQYGLESRVFGLKNAAQVAQEISGMAAVLHAAGPFIHTSKPMREACVQAGAHYLDITGEVDVFEACFALDEQAKENGIVVMPGVGFDVVPTDCLAKYVADSVNDVQDLELAFWPGSGPSAGTFKTMLEHMHKGVQTRRKGNLTPIGMGEKRKRLAFPEGEKDVMAISWGDLSTAYRSTGAPNITVYLAAPKEMIERTRKGGNFMRKLMAFTPVRRLAQRAAARRVKGPSAERRQKGRSQIWARASNAAGETKEAWLVTMEGYRFTAVASIRALEGVLGGNHKGSLTPAQAFGADFVMDLPDTTRMDAL